MNNRDITTESKRKGEWANILFWVHVVIFVAAAVFFFLELTIIFDWLKGPTAEKPEKFAIFKTSFWALWSLIIVQVAGVVVALSYKLLGLSIKKGSVNYKNEYSELIHGLMRNEIISKENGNIMLKILSDIPGRVAGTVWSRQK